MGLESTAGHMCIAEGSDTADPVLNLNDQGPFTEDKEPIAICACQASQRRT
jgi:hypothetical protein